MTLTTHALVGAAAAQLFPTHPYAAFTAGFASHLVIDSLPHWDYGEYLPSFQRDEKNPINNDMVIGPHFFVDLLVTAGDTLLGIALSIFIFSFSIFHAPVPIVLIGAVAGVLPDALQFVYFKTKSAVLEPLQRLHIWVQKGKSIYPPPWLGVSYQAALVAAVIVAEKIFI